MIKRKVFISSTVYDLHQVRKSMKRFLESQRVPNVRFKCMASEYPDFPLNIGHAPRHSLDVCIRQVAEADFFLLLLRSRYSGADVIDGSDVIGITHGEYRAAFRLCVPMLVFVDRRLWGARHLLRTRGHQNFVKPRHLPIFGFLEEVVKADRSNWIHQFSSTSTIRTALRANLLSADGSSFVSDVTYPDGAYVAPSSHFVKTWEIRNTGVQTWARRRLREVNVGASGLTPDMEEIPIPRTPPGSTVHLSVGFTAPSLPAVCESYWKMYDEAGRLCFPNHAGVWCRVHVRSRR